MSTYRSICILLLTTAVTLECTRGTENNEVQVSTATSKPLFCFFTNWAQYRQGMGKFFPEQVDPHLCTHGVYAFAKLNGNQLAPYEWDDDSTPWKKGLYERFNDLKKINPNFKTLLAVGGWNMKSEPFSQMAATKESRREFVMTSIQFLRNRTFDGLLLDWEYPGSRGGKPSDINTFTELLQELQAAYTEEAKNSNKTKLLLTSAVAAGLKYIKYAYDVPKISKTLDYVLVMSYDLMGPWANVTGLNSPLYPFKGAKGPDTQLNVEWVMKYWEKNGSPKNKLIVGLPTYGHTFTLVDDKDCGIGAPDKGAGPAGTFTRQAGFLAYYEICSLLKQGYKYVMDDTAKVPYAYGKAQYGGMEWISFDNQISLKTKVEWIKAQGYAGAFTWDYALDDFSGAGCGQGKYPLHNVIKNGLM
ncbi:acidic mammalian chitinase [Lingula anatina]|uniref:Acidic mammalian chitinase n=1 Tax=Lingula anatina TaxID=7574 RepID=A0A1S3IRK3_LINAN|nr:acidic mammalian chitinase [Lingula anatina]|eukprot:XP_013400159.1 acidic mammalian chitinase [Lingula anatina]